MSLRKIFKKLTKPFQDIVSEAQDLARGPGPRITTRMGVNQWVKSKTWVRVKSSWASAIRYDQDETALLVRFHDGATCLYPGVSADTAKRIFNANSVGKFIRNGPLRGLPYSKVRVKD